MLWNKIPKVYFDFRSTEQNSDFQGNATEQNFESLRLFLFHRNESPICYLFREMLKNKIYKVWFYFCLTVYSRNSVGNNHLFCLFRLPRNNFFSEIVNHKGYYTEKQHNIMAVAVS
jgi:hypothetical protein